MTVIRLHKGHKTIAEAEHWLAARPLVPGVGSGFIACTHLVPGSGVEITLSDEPVEGGRAVLYRGVSGLRGVMPVAELLARSAIERIHMLGGPIADEIDTRDFVRPQWMDGVLTLVCTPAPQGRIAPFEVPNPTPCCADH